MDDINNLTEYFYSIYSNMENIINKTVEIDIYTLYIEFNNGKEFTYDAHIDEFVNITNYNNLSEDKKRYRFRIILVKQMKKYRLSCEMVGKRIR